MHLRFVSSLIVSGLLTIPLASREAVYTHARQSAPPPQQAATGLANELPSLIAVMRSLPELALRTVDGEAPLLVTVGTGDPLQPQSVAFAKASKGARLLTVTDADHMPIASSPELHQALRTLIADGR